MINNNNSKSDPRPLRDPNFMKDAKQKLIKFLESTNYPHRIDIAIFGKLTQSDVKAIFEHFIGLIVPDFRFCDTQIAPEDQILKFFTAIQYSNNLSKTHITSPAIFSSVPFVIGAFDFLRRFVSTFIRTNPKMLFPRLTNYYISSEVVLDSLISISQTNPNLEYHTSNLTELVEAIRNEIGIKSSREIMKISENVYQIEQMQINVQRLEYTIKEMFEESDRIANCIQTENEKYSQSKEILHKLQLEIRDETNSSEVISKEVAQLVAKRSEYEEKGYSDTINQIEDFQEKLARKRVQFQQSKLEMEELKQTTRSMELEVDDVRFHLLRTFADVDNIFPNLVNENIRQQISDFKLEYLLNYDGHLRPYISNLISAIESKAHVKRDELEQHVKQSEDLKRNSEVLKSDIKLLEFENEISVKNLNESEPIFVRLQEELEEHFKTIQKLSDKMSHQREVNDCLDGKLTEGKRRLEEEKYLFEESNQFFEVDIDFKKECADIRLQSIEECHDYRKALMKRNEEFIEEAKENNNSFQADLEHRKHELLSRITSGLSSIGC